MSWRMRLTLQLDDDVARRLKRLHRKGGTSLQALVNQALREGLARLDFPHAPRKRHVTRSVALGGCLVGDVDPVAERLAQGERLPEA